MAFNNFKAVSIPHCPDSTPPITGRVDVLNIIAKAADKDAKELTERALAKANEIGQGVQSSFTHASFSHRKFTNGSDMVGRW